MSVTEKLVPGVLVWAKVEPYPWWPGRILKSIEQKGQQVFKIAFFADPTYTYLHSHQIIPFQQFDTRLNGQDNQHPALQRAVKMAQGYLYKQNALLCHQDNQQSSKRLTIPSLPSKMEEFGEQNSDIPSERNSGLAPPEEVLSDPMALESHKTEVTVENVIELLQREETTKKRQGYCYEQRKEHVRYQDKLREALLRRYNLLNFASKNKSSCSQKPIIQITVNTNSHLPEKKHKRINKGHLSRKSLLNDQIQFLSRRCIKKINSILKESSDSNTNARFHSMQIVRRIILLADNNHLKFKSLFVTLVKTMSCNSKGLNCEERLCDFRQYLQRLEGEKGQDQEGSRITQIETSMN